MRLGSALTDSGTPLSSRVGLFDVCSDAYSTFIRPAYALTTVRRGNLLFGQPPVIEFNATHSGALTVFAFTVGCQIGVDLEQIRRLTEAQHIAERFFCSEEAAEIMSLRPSERERAFFCCWTRKAAYIKVIGEGLSAPLTNFV